MSPVEDPQGSAGDGSTEKKVEEHVVEFEAPSRPTLVATSPYQMTLQWKQLVLKSEADSSRIEGLAPIFTLEVNLVSLLTFSASVTRSVHAISTFLEQSTSSLCFQVTGGQDAKGKWSCAYQGPLLIEQVKLLLITMGPGRTCVGCDSRGEEPTEVFAR